MREQAEKDNHAIVHSLFSTFILEILSLMRRHREQAAAAASSSGAKLHGKLLADEFVKLVEQSDKTMQEIADELNFSSASAFGKYVREHTGMTPLEFRKKYQQK